MHNTIYPHTQQIVKVTIFPNPIINKDSQAHGVASVLLRYGPVSLRAKLWQGTEKMFLSMPARKNETSGEWYDHVFFTDRTLHDTYEALAISEFHKLNSARLVAA